MNIAEFLYTMIIAPIEMIVEWVFTFYKLKIGVGGIMGCIAALSIAVNFLALPLYNIADALQEKERDTEKKMKSEVDKINAVFKGNERYMILSTYYRQMHYHPIMQLRSAFSLLIQIPFFIAAYHFLSRSPSLQGASFAFLGDLGAPDALIKFTMPNTGGGAI